MVSNSSVSMASSATVSMASGHLLTNPSESDSAVSSPDPEDSLMITEGVDVGQNQENYLVMRTTSQPNSSAPESQGIMKSSQSNSTEITSGVQRSESHMGQQKATVSASQGSGGESSGLVENPLLPAADPSHGSSNSYYEQSNVLLSTGPGQNNQELLLSMDRTLQKLAEDMAKQNCGHQTLYNDTAVSVDVKSDISELVVPGLTTPLYTLPLPVTLSGQLNQHVNSLVSMSSSSLTDHVKKDSIPHSSTSMIPSLLLPQINKPPESGVCQEESGSHGAKQGLILDRIRSVLTSNVISGSVPLYTNPKPVVNQDQASNDIVVHSASTASHASLNTAGQASFSAIGHASANGSLNVFSAVSGPDTHLGHGTNPEAGHTSVFVESLPTSEVHVAAVGSNHSHSASRPAASLSEAVVLQPVSGPESGIHTMDLLPTLPSYTDNHHIIESYLVENNQGRPLEAKAAPKVPAEDVINVTNIFPSFQPAPTTNLEPDKNHSSVIELFLGASDMRGEAKQCDSECEVQVINSSDVTPVNSTYCVECNSTYSPTCPKHDTDYKHITDRPIESRARMSLPPQLSLVSEGKPSTVTGVSAGEEIPAKMVFGPIVGEMWSADKLVGSHSDFWQLFVESRPTVLLDCRSEDNSNWLRFVKRAQTNMEQNLVAYQLGLSLYFVTTKLISPGQHLKYWYSKEYASLMDLPPYPDDVGKCSICQKHFSSQESLARHKTQMHPVSKNRKFHCPVCQKPFVSRTKVDIHMSKHTGARPFPCTVCSKHFTDKSNLRKHMKIHNDVKEHVCVHCNKTFRQRAHLDTHLLVHTGEKRLVCTYCNRKFARANDLKQHVYLHTKEQQFPCTVCGRTFHRKTNLRKHQEIHSTDRVKLPCDRCGKDFPNKYHLKRHQTTCKGKKPMIAQIRSETGAELGLSIAKKRIQKRDNQRNNQTLPKTVT